jgi:hypothetical protein
VRRSDEPVWVGMPVIESGGYAQLCVLKEKCKKSCGFCSAVSPLQIRFVAFMLVWRARVADASKANRSKRWGR